MMLIIVILNTIIIHSEEDFLLLCFNREVFLQSVEPKIEGDQLDNMLANMTSGENSQLSNLVNVGDSQAALRMVGAINSLLNAQSTKTPSGNDSEREGARKEKRKEVNCLKMINLSCVWHIEKSVYPLIALRSDTVPVSNRELLGEESFYEVKM